MMLFFSCEKKRHYGMIMFKANEVKQKQTKKKRDKIMTNYTKYDFIHILERDMAMYDDLSRNQPLKKDRDIAKQQWFALEGLAKEIEKKFK